MSSETPSATSDLEGRLQHLQQPFERGDYAETRARASAVLADASAPTELRASAEELLARTQPAPLSLWMLGLTALLLLGLVLLAYAGHLHG
jgi:hypothetical protein